MIEFLGAALVIVMLPLGCNGCDEHSATNDSGSNGGGGGHNPW